MHTHNTDVLQYPLQIAARNKVISTACFSKLSTILSERPAHMGGGRGMPLYALAYPWFEIKY